MTYALWHTELKTPTPEERRLDRTIDPTAMLGFWRMEGARTKPDYPVAIFVPESGEGVIIQIGKRQLSTGGKDGDKIEEFMGAGWLKCVAVPEADWALADSTGRWPDSKPARELSEAEKLDLIPDTPREEGGNALEGGMDEQIIAKLGSALEKAKALPFPIKTMEVAEQAAGVVETLRGLGKQGEAKRKEQKQPHLDAGAAVDAKWLVVKEASEMIQRIVSVIDTFKRAEEARLRREAEAAAEVERQRLAREAEEALRAEAEAAGVTVSDEEIGARAMQQATEQVAEVPPPDTTVRISTPHGRGISKPKKKVGVITDKAAFIAALAGQADFSQWLEEKAMKLARAGVALDGMVIKEE